MNSKPRRYRLLSPWTIRFSLPQSTITVAEVLLVTDEVLVKEVNSNWSVVQNLRRQWKRRYICSLKIILLSLPCSSTTIISSIFLTDSLEAKCLPEAMSMEYTRAAGSPFYHSISEKVTFCLQRLKSFGSGFRSWFINWLVKVIYSLLFTKSSKESVYYTFASVSWIKFLYAMIAWVNSLILLTTKAVVMMTMSRFTRF